VAAVKLVYIPAYSQTNPRICGIYILFYWLFLNGTTISKQDK